MTTIDGIKHGVYRYNKGCRCDECRAAKAAKAKERYKRDGDKIRARNLRWYYANADHAKASAKRWQAANRDKVRGYVAKWSAANPEWERQWAAANPDRVRAKTRRYLEAHPGKSQEWNAVRRSRRLAAETYVVTAADWRRLCERHRNQCFYCGEARPLTQDHIIPLTRGGRHSIGNLVPACKSCNSRKNARLIVEWKAALRAT